jgi:hypothetical protein
MTCSPPGTCSIVIPAPSAALVFLFPSHLTGGGGENSGGGARSTTYSTTILTRTAGTATVDSLDLATSNGHTGMDAKNELGSTCHGSFSASGAVGVRARS